MAGVLQHLRSSTLNKRPNPASMVDGQIAINYASGSPGAFFKDTNGNLVKVGPVHVGATAPNISPASGGTAGNSLGEQWLDTSGGTYVFKIWDGAAWRSEAGEFVNAAGDTMTGSLTMGPSANLIFEGSTDDGFETTLTVVDPTADRTITLPNVSGTVVTTGDSGTVTSTMIADGAIVNADVNASAAIAGTKISPDFGSQTITTTGVVSAAIGAAATPSITFTGDTNTGIYSPGADQVAISTGGSGRLFVDASGRIGIGTGSPITKLDVRSGVITAGSNSSPEGTEILRGYYSATEGALAVIGTEHSSGGIVMGSAVKPSTSASDAFLSSATVNVARGAYTIAGNTHKWYIGAVQTVAENSSVSTSEVMRIDGSGRLLVGTSSARSNFYNTTYAPQIQLEGNDNSNSALSIISCFNGNNIGGQLILGKANSGSVGANGIVGNGTPLGRLSFQGNDGSEFVEGAAITAEVDGTPGANDMPGRIVLSTTADGASSPTERLRITSAGLVGVGASDPAGLGGILAVQRNQTADTAIVVDNNGTPGGSTTASFIVSDGGGGSKSWFRRYRDGSGNTAIGFTDALLFEGNVGATKATRAVIDSSGRVGIGTTSPGEMLTVTNGNIRINSSSPGNNGLVRFYSSDNAEKLQIFVSTTEAALYTPSPIPLKFQVAGTESARIDSSGRLLVGTSSSRGAYAGNLEIEATSTAATIAVTRNSNDTSPSYIFLAKSRSTSVGGNAIVNSGDTLGYIGFLGTDGTSPKLAASITSEVDATPGANDMPGRLVFSTTADGASSPTERMRIANSGTVTISGPGGGTFLNLSNSGGYSGLHEVDNTAYTIGQNSDVRAMRIGSGANWLTTGVNLAPGGTSWGTYSDERLKTDIVELTDCLDDIKGIRCVSYRLTDVDDANSKKRIGVIAQDLVGKYDEAINASRRSENDETEYLSVQYSDLIPVLLKALQEASVKIESLEARLTAAGI